MFEGPISELSLIWSNQWHLAFFIDLFSARRMEVHMMGLLEYILLPSTGSTHPKPFEVSKGYIWLPLCQRDDTPASFSDHLVSGLLLHPGLFHGSLSSQHSVGETSQGLANPYKVLIIRTCSFTLHCSWTNSPHSLFLVSLIKEPLEPFVLLSAHFPIAHPCWHSASPSGCDMPAGRWQPSASLALCFYLGDLHKHTVCYLRLSLSFHNWLGCLLSPCQVCRHQQRLRSFQLEHFPIGLFFTAEWFPLVRLTPWGGLLL